MSAVLFFMAAAVYGLAGTLFLAHLAGKATRPVAWGPRLLAGAAAFHAAHIVARWVAGEGPLAGVREAVSALALLVVVVFLVAHLFQRRVDVVGAFVTPLTLLLLLGSRAPSTRSVAHVHGALFAVHLGSTMLGTAAFTVAFGMSLAFLLQERQVKRKRLTGLFRRLPPLEVLDDIGYRCVAVGLPALTLGIVSGLFVGARAAQLGTAWQQYVGLGAWVLFAGVLLLRLVAGWRGRRAALGTILGYASTLLVVLGYYFRGSAP